MKKHLIAACLGGGLAAAMAGPVAAQTQIAWGGSNPGGVMYYMVGVAGTLFSDQIDDLNVTQVTTGGSTENAKRLIAGELDMGIVYGAHVYMSLHNEGPFQNDPKGEMLRGVAKAYEGPTYFVTLQNSEIERIEDLAGKRVALGPPGSGTVFNCSNMLRALELLDDVDPTMMTFADAGRALANGQVDAVCQSSAPAAAVSELAETRGVRILEYTEEQMATIREMYPFYNTGYLSEDVYTGVPETRMPFMTVYWVAHERVPADVVERMLEVAYQEDNRRRLAEGHAAWAQMEPDTANFLALGAPMHPGAEAYYKREGLWEE
ncbi:TAXI family TRAP transporter solute-binding subunit [Spiribacter halobius]|uniref:TRAP transporter substrate-binding protein n=1 Tax=Sediminicurvatus halobius TaxID=2182432 RepID=A0A2U2N9N3_9GAMM|nr:TAXI family TRAP transporter solute-binding subunit [Spiribacter halobius]PWG65803.1 TRAP transporter substrate-binding protein [Spiribacter halobius]UEX77845.1 TAXI family TRAP transporter solute-binding subunit [Spiribacter halobius]